MEVNKGWIVFLYLLAVWYYIGEFYQGAIFFFAKLILLTMGYVALAIATPGWRLRDRGEMLCIQ